MRGRCLLKLSGCLLPIAVSVLFLPKGKAGDPAVPETWDCSEQARNLINEKLRIWQQRLKLENWKISVTTTRLTELKPKTLGNIHWDADKKTAIIRVLSPSDYQFSCSDALKDIEFTIVHELIHLEQIGRAHV